MNAINAYIDFDDLPVSAGLKVERLNDPWLGYDEDERNEAQEFIAWYLRNEHGALFLIPLKSASSGFWVEGFNESAFNTHDFDEAVGAFRFDTRAYRETKALEQIEDLAVMHCCISDSVGRAHVKRRCRNLVESEFVYDLVRHMRLANLAADSERYLHHRREVRRYIVLIVRAAKVWRDHNPVLSTAQRGGLR